MQEKGKPFRSFRQFWPYYTSQHRNPTNRLLHVIGSLLGIAVGVICIFYLGLFLGVSVGLCVGYCFAWIGHSLFEKNIPATFRHPFYSFYGDFQMILKTLQRSPLVEEPEKMSFLITGASRGIGLALTKHFLSQGHFVFAGSRTSESEIDQLASRYPTLLQKVILDVTDSDQILATFNLIRQIGLPGKLILINNAGISGGGPVEVMPEKHWTEIYKVNVFGLLNTTARFIPLVRETQGRIINIGSISGRITTPLLTCYSSSKHAVRSITDGLRRELSPFGVSVVLIEPGPIVTDIWKTSLAQSQEMVNMASPEITFLYTKELASLAADVNNISTLAVSVNDLVQTVDEAVHARKPQPYYRVGKNALLLFLLAQYFPAKLLDRLLRNGLRFKGAK